jgi:tol-pal system protein YbgF
MPIRRAIALACFVALALTVPAAGADKETRQMMADIRILQEQSQQLQNLIASLNAALTEAIKAVNARIDEQTAVSRKSLADQKLIIDTMANDLRILREKVDDNSVRVGSVGQELDALRQAVAALNTPRPPEGDTFTPAAAADAGGSAAGATPVGASPQKLWDGAMADYYAGQYDLAILGLEAYVKSFPQSPQSANAQLHVGISYSQQGKYDKAVEAYDAVIRTYPKSSVVPDAYVRKGQAHMSLKQYDKAREALEYVIKNYADNVAATVAQQRLKDIQDITAPAKR